MRIATLRRDRRSPELPGVSGVARLDRCTRDLVKRLRPGDIAVIDHLDLDQASAQALVACRVGAVVNASPSTSGRYPNLGPEILVAAGVPLLDRAGPDVLKAVDEGQLLRLDGQTLYRDEETVAEGHLLTPDDVQTARDHARDGLAAQLEALLGDTVEYLRQEHPLLLDREGLPDLRIELAGRHALVVVPGHGHERDLASLRRYIRDARPVLIGVDAGADALLAAGHRPDLVVGDLALVSDQALTCGAELVQHVHRDGRAPGAGRLEELGLASVPFAATGTSEDVALLLAEAKGADLLVTAGMHTDLEELLDNGRTGLASGLVTRLRVGGKLVDARAVARLPRRGVPVWPLLLLVGVGVVALVATLVVVGPGQAVEDLRAGWDPVVQWARELR